MNRRDVFKLAGGALLASAAVRCGSKGRREGPEGDFIITMQGPGLLRFPSNGSWARMQFTDLSQAAGCATPLHLPRIKINDPEALKVTVGGRPAPAGQKEWVISGMSVAPAMEHAFKAVDFNQQPTMNPYAHPKSEAEWRSLKWIPKFEKLTSALSDDVVASKTVATVAMTSGELTGDVPGYDRAIGTLWMMKTYAEWESIKMNHREVPQQAMTDRLRLTGRYTGGAARLTLGSLLQPSATFDVELRPTTPGAAVEISIVAEPPQQGGHTAQTTRPLPLYCGYYDFTRPLVRNAERVLPYRSDMKYDYSKVYLPELLDGQSGYTGDTPDPYCGPTGYIKDESRG